MARKTDTLTQLDADRLCAAADAAWGAAAEIGRNLHMTPPRPDRLKGSLIEPQSLRPFSREEIREATEFLIRLGCQFGPLLPGRPG
jgi:hypothetical protein